MTYIPLAGITQMVPPGGAGVGMHVIPVEKQFQWKMKLLILKNFLIG